MRSIARSRHENINGQIKAFKILNSHYRGKLNKHYLFFYSVAIMTQIDINNGNKLFQINYNNN